MKRILLITFGLLAGLTVSAQYYQDAVNKDMLHIRQARTLQRVHIDLPEIDGYTPYKADLHTHTIFSDGHLTMEARLREAWQNGLDVMAVTEHLEYRPHEKTLVKYLNNYMPKGTEAKANSFVSKNEPAKGEIMVDFNFPVEHAKKIAAGYDITIIPGIEVTRKPGGLYSHFNALFTTDNNTIYDPDPMQSLRNAKAQGALVMHNHPGWTRTDMTPSKFDKEAYKEGLIDGIETMNGVEFYPKAITRAWKYNFFVSSNTDVHYPIAERYDNYDEFRNMTLIFAKDKSLASLREALEARRTLACSFGVLAGDEALIRKVLEASVTVRRIADDAKGRKQIVVTNNSSIRWIIAREGQRTEELRPFSSQIYVAKSKDTTATLLNTWYGEKNHLTVNFFEMAK
jgi:hypothetical protein